MTNDELDQARAEEAFEQSKAGDLFTDIAAYAARLAREGWTPPVVVDPDIAEAWDLVALNACFDNHGLVLSAIKRGRAIAAETKPVVVDPDIAAAWDLAALNSCFDNHGLVLSAIKRGRALAAVTHYFTITQPEYEALQPKEDK